MSEDFTKTPGGTAPGEAAGARQPGTEEYRDYRAFREELCQELADAADRFVRIGHLLRLARDTGILRGSGYRNVNEFAREEFGLDKSQVSRFINITKRFGDPLDPGRLEEQYKGFGYAKLAIMMQLPEGINEELSPAYSKDEIQAIKEEVDAERAVTDIEVMLEGRPEPTGSAPEGGGNLCRMLYQLCGDSPALLRDLWGALKEPGGISRELDGSRTAVALAEVLAPQGEAVHIARVPGTGRLSLMAKSADSDLSLVNIRTSEKARYAWADLAMNLGHLFEGTGSPEEAFEKLYQKPFPEKEKVAPVQPPAQGAKKEPPKKQGRVTRAKAAPAKIAPAKADPEEGTPTEKGPPKEALPQSSIRAGVEKMAQDIEDLMAAESEAMAAAVPPENPGSRINTPAGADSGSGKTPPETTQDVRDLLARYVRYPDPADYTIDCTTTPERLEEIWDEVSYIRLLPGWEATIRIYKL